MSCTLGLLAFKLLVRQQHDAVENESNEDRAANQAHKGRAGVSALSRVSAHDSQNEEVMGKRNYSLSVTRTDFMASFATKLGRSSTPFVILPNTV